MPTGVIHSALQSRISSKRDPASFRKSTAVILVLSGTLLAGCGREEDRGWSGSEPLTNNTYRSSYGYYHAPYRAWFPFPYNYYDPSRGYYHGGQYSAEPNVSGIRSSVPVRGSSAHISRGGFGSHGTGIS